MVKTSAESCSGPAAHIAMAGVFGSGVEPAARDELRTGACEAGSAKGPCWWPPPPLAEQFLQPSHRQASVHSTPAWKHSQ